MSDITAGLNSIGLDFYTEAVKSVTNHTSAAEVSGDDNSFSAILNSAMNLVKETDSLSQDAEQAAMDFTLGNTDSTHELTIAQQKAYLSLQYTVAVKNAFLDAYKEIMQIQI
ncbi:MAG: flagellar hook-basal body complex protein FliE [Lachnospiraceae bacterium]|nr:flagellar hook-basal body complex protein FliE [Lachnospiraceae bacterium]